MPATSVQVLKGTKRYCWFPLTRVTGGCEPLNVGTGTQVLWKKTVHAFLMDELSLLLEIYNSKPWTLRRKTLRG